MTRLSDLLDAIKQVESGGNPNARSPAGAMGAYQFMPATAREFGLKNPYDEKEARAAAERKISGLLNEYDGDLPKALAAYNMGQGNLKKVKGDYTRVPETRDYVARVGKILGGLSPISTAEASESPWDADPDAQPQKATEAQNSAPWDADPDAEPQQAEQAQPQTVMPFGLPTGFSQGANDVAEGVKANLEKKKIGLQQIGSDLARDVTGEVGQDYSPYREEVNARGRTLNRESREGSLARKLGETLPDIASAPLLPVPEAGLAAAATRIPANAGMGGLYAALQPYETPQERIQAMGQGALIGAAIPEGLGMLGATARTVNPKGLGGRLAAAEMARQLEAKFGKGAKLELNAPTVPESVRGEAGQKFMGPPQPRFGFVNGVEPTAAMLNQDNQKLLELERFARLTNGPEFAARDLKNTEAVADALQSRALGDKDANVLQDALNQTTGPIRKTSMSLANLSGGFSEPAAKMLSGLKPIGDEGRIQKLAAPFLEEGSPEGLYMLRKELDDKLRMNGPGLDEATNAVKNSRRLVTELKSKIDEGLNQSSHGLWDVYLKSHAKGMEPIAEGRTFQDILDRFDTKAPLPSGKPGITPHALRTAAEKERWTDLGKAGFKDKTGDVGGLVLSDSIDTMNAIERAKSPGNAVNGSQTTPLLMTIAKKTPVIGKGASALQALKNAAGGQNILTEALLNPQNGKLAEIIKAYEASGQPPPKWLLRAYRASGAAGANAGR